MGIFSKETCSACGKESRFGIYSFSNKNETASLCRDCLVGMNVDGYLSYTDYIGRPKPTYNDLKEYQALYNSIVDNEKNIYPALNRQASGEASKESLVYSLGSISINCNFMAISSYPNLVIKSPEVFAITLDSIREMSSTSIDAIRISFFTNNPHVPFFSTITAGKINFFAMSLKSKKYREAIVYVLSACCQNLKYDIDSSKALRKVIKSDDTYHESIDKEKLLDLLYDAKSDIHLFSPKKVLDHSSEMQKWAVKLNKEMGYIYVN